MPLFSISTGQPVLATTLTSLTLGYGPNMTAPPDLLVWSAASGGTVTLPAIAPILPSPPTTPGTSPGVGDGLKITIWNTTGNALTLTPAGSDSIDTYFASGVNTKVTLQAQESTTTWKNITGSGAVGPWRYVAGNATIATTDRYLIDTTAGTITLPALSNFPTYTPFITIVSSNVLLTVAPASGNINGQAALTIAAAKEATLLSDGTNFFATAG